MTAQTLHTAAYDEYERGILTLHQLSLAGEDGSPAADHVRDRLLAPWSQLTPEQREFGDGVSGDLYMLEPDEGEIYEPASSEERSPQRLGLAIKSAWDHQDWPALLALLRKGPAFMPPVTVAALRAHAYDRLGSPAVAIAFARYARRLDPTDADVELVEFMLLRRVGTPEQVTAAAWEYVNAGRPAVLVVAAAGRLFQATRTADEVTAQQTRRRLADALRVVVSADDLDLAVSADGMVSYAYLLLGGCLDLIGDEPGARQAYDSALATAPHEPGRFAFEPVLKAYARQRFGGTFTNGSPDQRSTLFEMTATFAPSTAA